MCLAVPLKVIELDGEDAVVERSGVRRKIKTGFIKALQIGEFVLVHAGFAIQKVDETQALDALDAFRELEEVLNG